MDKDEKRPTSDIKEDIQFRMDLVVEDSEVLEEDEDGVRVGQVMKPNPERYDRVDDGEQKGWIDTFENTFIPEDVLAEMWEEQAEGLPIYYSPDQIDDWQEYCTEIYNSLYTIFDKNGLIAPSSTDTGFLKQYAESQDEIHPFVILKADLVGSTKMAARYDSDLYYRILAAFEYLVVDVVRKHNGYYLKKEGDGIYAFFPSPNTTGKHDNAALCALRIKNLVSDLLSGALSDNGYSEVEVTIGLDSGNPEIVPDGNDNFELIGLTMNLASKIADAAEPNEVLLGQFTERNLHTKYRKMTQEVTQDREWGFSEGDTLYPIYLLKDVIQP
ncbi:adenylate/guanylate cyclase domain-containing protein [Halobellus inordinatus]|uniref:adenylate/guanylate cyclase domain-containing protein n=1 Tax=Halobellus inordinatus TaxID=1126236 RepID=UPI0021139FF2|nr:adenylate/guanylate cyclase domain-containing protein [Halobellus ramosii]